MSSVVYQAHCAEWGGEFPVYRKELYEYILIAVKKSIAADYIEPDPNQLEISEMEKVGSGKPGKPGTETSCLETGQGGASYIRIPYGLPRNGILCGLKGNLDSRREY